MRTVLKTITYTCIHITVAYSVAFALSGNWKVALGISLLEPMIQSITYFLHESAWNRPAPVRIRTRVS